MTDNEAGQPVIPYGRQWIDDDDVDAVTAILRSDWLTTGPSVEAFEKGFCELTGAAHAVAVSSGTAALHAAMFALEIGPGDEVIVPPMTFAASANCVLYQGGTPVFADVDPSTLLLDPARVAERITRQTKAIVAVDYAGQPCDYTALRQLAAAHGLKLVADACHSIGGSDQGRQVGTLADISCFSFHPVKHITTGEGGLSACSDPALAARMRIFRNHGITTDHRQRSERGSWFYEMTELGYNYRITDFQCALGLRQLGKLRQWVDRRQEIAAAYDSAFAGNPRVRPLGVREGVSHAYHLYPVQVHGLERQIVFQNLRAAGILANVHYIPVHLHPYYRNNLGTGPGLCPVAETAYERLLSLPMFPRMSDADVHRVIGAVRNSVG